MIGSAIGEFVIGISPIGQTSFGPFDFNVTIISQYANSPRLLSMINNFGECMDQSVNMDEFYNKIWNIDSAEGYGLDVWGRIVGVSRTLRIPSSNVLGFNEAGDVDSGAWNQYPFYTGVPFTENYSLSDEAYRNLILAKAFANICDGSIISINTLLMTIFGDSAGGGSPGRAYVTDGQDMTMTYTFEYPLTPVQYAIVTQSGVLPTPTGVFATIVAS